MASPAVPCSPLRDDVVALSAYQVPDSAGMVKLDAMENPYPLPPAMQHKLAAALAGTALNRYPDPRYRELKAAIARYQHLPAVLVAGGIVLGNGSDELISLLCLAVARPGAVVMAPQPSFVMYEMSARLAGARFVGLPLLPSFALDEAAMLAAIEREQPALLFLAYPNNPSGTLFDEAVMARLIAAMQGVGLVVIDEAYFPFAGDTWAMRFDPALHPHVVIVRTLSKLGLAGIRLGFMVGAEMATLEKIRPPYNINVLSATAALTLLPEEDLWQEQAAAILAERARLAQALQGYGDVTESAANFVLLRLHRGEAKAVFEALRDRGVLVKNVSAAHPLLHNCLRISVGLPQENERLLSALAQLPV